MHMLVSKRARLKVLALVALTLVLGFGWVLLNPIRLSILTLESYEISCIPVKRLDVHDLMVTDSRGTTYWNSRNASCEAIREAASGLLTLEVWDRNKTIYGLRTDGGVWIDVNETLSNRRLVLGSLQVLWVSIFVWAALKIRSAPNIG